MATPNSRTLSVEFLTEFIRIYKSHPALWKVKSKEYANKYLKKNGYEELVQLSQSAISTADKDFVVRKINSLRGAFRKEHQKVRKSLSSGNSDDMLYVPNLWYYNLLLFTANQDSDIGDIKSDLFAKDDSVDSIDDGEPERTEMVVNTKPQRKRNIKEEFAYIIQTQPVPQNTPPSLPDIPSTTTPNTSTSMLDKKEDEYDAFGFVVAAKLRKMTEDQRIHAEFLINQIIHKGLLNNLSTNTNIEDG